MEINVVQIMLCLSYIAYYGIVTQVYHVINKL